MITPKIRINLHLHYKVNDKLMLNSAFFIYTWKNNLYFGYKQEEAIMFDDINYKL